MALVHAALPLLGPKVCSCEHKTCALLSSFKKKKKMVDLSPAFFLSLHSRESPCGLSPLDTMWWADLGTGYLCLGAHLLSWLYSSQGEAPTAYCLGLPPIYAGPAPLRCFCPSYWSKGGFLAVFG